jgi:DNA-binding transcriptional MerR regulator
MHHFSIRDVENLCGIKAHTLRMWEQRYGLCTCKRRESKHRYYDAEDLKYILRIAYLYHHGYRISRIVQLSAQEIIELASKKTGSDEYGLLINQLLEAGLDYNQEQFENSFQGTVRTMGLENSIEKVIYPFLDKIGLLWMTGHVLPAQEHFCSHLIQKKIIAAINALPALYNGHQKLLLFTPEGENHELPLLVIQYIMKRKGFKTILLGKNISMDIVQSYCSQQPATHLCFHLVTNFTYPHPAEYLDKLSASFSEKKIIASGPALKNIKETPDNVSILRSFQELMSLERYL